MEVREMPFKDGRKSFDSSFLSLETLYMILLYFLNQYKPLKISVIMLSHHYAKKMEPISIGSLNVYLSVIQDGNTQNLRFSVNLKYETTSVIPKVKLIGSCHHS
jgi:hypothetical protein